MKRFFKDFSGLSYVLTVSFLFSLFLRQSSYNTFSVWPMKEAWFERYILCNKTQLHFLLYIPWRFWTDLFQTVGLWLLRTLLTHQALLEERSPTLNNTIQELIQTSENPAAYSCFILCCYQCTLQAIKVYYIYNRVWLWPDTGYPSCHQNMIGLSMFYPKEKDQVWHKAQHYFTQGDNYHTPTHPHSYTGIIKQNTKQETKPWLHNI